MRGDFSQQYGRKYSKTRPYGGWGGDQYYEVKDKDRVKD